MAKHTNQIVTWATSGGSKIDICTACQSQMEATGEGWPKDGRGESYAQVHQGLHRGECGLDRDSEGARWMRGE